MRGRRLVYWSALFWVLVIAGIFLQPLLFMGDVARTTYLCSMTVIMSVASVSWIGALWHAVVVRLRHDPNATAGWPFLMLFLPFLTPFYATKFLRPSEAPASTGEPIPWTQWMRRAKWFLIVLAAVTLLGIASEFHDWREANNWPERTGVPPAAQP